MQLTVEVENEIYDELKTMGIDIQSKIKEYLKNLIDDGYPTISKEEANKRVADAVERYDSGKGEYLQQKEYDKEMEVFFETLK